MKKKSIKTACVACDGTGLYSGMCEAKGTAVVCIYCSGTGCEEIWYEPFVSRKGRKGVRTVSLSRGSFIASGVGAVGNSISYAEFAKGKMPRG